MEARRLGDVEGPWTAHRAGKLPSGRCCLFTEAPPATDRELTELDELDESGR